MPLNRTPNELNREARKGINENWEKLESVQGQIDNLVLESGKSDLEVVQARGGRNVLNTRITEIEAKSNNPLGTMQTQGTKIPLSSLNSDVISAMTGNTEITNADGYLENNRGVDFPLRNMNYMGEVSTITEKAKNVILDAKIFGAKVDCFYRVVMISNGYVNGGKERWGITLYEYPISTFSTTGEGTQLFYYASNKDSSGSWEKQSEGIETISLDNGEIACSITIDRSKIDGEFLNLNVNARSAIIDPSNYFF